MQQTRPLSARASAHGTSAHLLRSSRAVRRRRGDKTCAFSGPVRCGGPDDLSCMLVVVFLVFLRVGVGVSLQMPVQGRVFVLQNHRCG